MKIEIWSDFQCPFCYMGETMLEQALASIALSEPVEIIYRSYQLDPEAPAIPAETMTEHFMGDHEMTRQEAETRMEKITKMAAAVGLDYNLAGVKVCNTRDAHRLMKYATERLNPGRLKRLNFSLFKANFIDNLLLSNHNLLTDLAEDAGLDRAETLSMLAGNEYAEEVAADQREIDARPDFEFVPFMLLANGAVLQGVLTPEKLTDWLQAAMADPTATADAPREGCGPDGCAL